MNNEQLTTKNHQLRRKFSHFLGFFCSLSIVYCLFFSAPPAFASFPVHATPAVIDGEGKVREILHYTVKFENNTNSMVSLYPWIRNVTDTGETDPEHSDPTISLANWFSFSRSSLDMLAGESRELPIQIQIDMHAKPGYYHAILRFGRGGNRTEAEQNTAETVSVMVNIRVEDDINERLQLGTFQTDKNFYTGDTASFSYRIENIGNRGVVPEGTIRIYDRKGEEVASLEANKDGQKIEPNAKSQLGAVWASGGHFGQYKALLDVNYGDKGTLQDTVFFWVLPWKQLLSFFITLAIVLVIVALLIHSYSASGRNRLQFSTISSSERKRKEHSQLRAHEEDEYENNDMNENGILKRAVAFLAPPYRLPFFDTPLEDDAALPVIDDEPVRSRFNELRKVNIPPPSRTRYSSLDMRENTSNGPRSRTFSEESHRIELTARPKAQPDPRHIITLKRK